MLSAIKYIKLLNLSIKRNYTILEILKLNFYLKVIYKKTPENF